MTFRSTLNVTIILENKIRIIIKKKRLKTYFSKKKKEITKIVKPTNYIKKKKIDF